VIKVANESSEVIGCTDTLMSQIILHANKRQWTCSIRAANLTRIQHLRTNIW